MDVGFWEMFMLAVLALLIFGPERLPSIARNVGRAVGKIRREASATFEALRDETELAELREFTSELQHERDQLTSATRLDLRGSTRRSSRERGDASSAAVEEPRYDAQAT